MKEAEFSSAEVTQLNATSTELSQQLAVAMKPWSPTEATNKIMAIMGKICDWIKPAVSG